MRKTEARSLFRQKRMAVTVSQKTRWDDLLLIQFQQLQLPYLSAIMSFYPADEKGETDTFPISRYLQFINPGLLIAYPRITAAQTMEAVVPEDEDAFAPNAFGIAEPTSNNILSPQDIDLVLVPLLAFDERGNRAGYGKGYYDRFLAQCRPDCLKMGLSYFEPVPLLEDAGEFDIPLNFCITPQQAYVF